jgi:hypothetical protein
VGNPVSFLLFCFELRDCSNAENFFSLAFSGHEGYADRPGADTQDAWQLGGFGAIYSRSLEGFTHHSIPSFNEL